MISVFIAPPSTWQPPVTQPQNPPPPQLEKADLEIVETLRKEGRYGSLVWPLLNKVAEIQPAQTRAELRETRLNLWHRLRRLIKAEVVFRFGRKRVSVFKLPKHTVNRRRRSRCGSAPRPKTMQMHPAGSKTCPTSLEHRFDGTLPTPPAVEKTQSALAVAPLMDLVTPTQERNCAGPAAATKEPQDKIHQPARQLARLPRGLKRRWSGYVNGVRIWRGRRIVLPGGRLVYAYGAVRGKVVWTSRLTDPTGKLSEQTLEWDVVDAKQVRLAKDPNAVALGRLKAGVREQKSEAKILTARANGKKPCRPGRRRGAPRRLLTANLGRKI